MIGCENSLNFCFSHLSSLGVGMINMNENEEVRGEIHFKHIK